MLVSMVMVRVLDRVKLVCKYQSLEKHPILIVYLLLRDRFRKEANNLTYYSKKHLCIGNNSYNVRDKRPRECKCGVVESQSSV